MSVGVGVGSASLGGDPITEISGEVCHGFIVLREV
jgi:hypothetical protein